MQTRLLTIEQHKIFESFLRKRHIRFKEVATIISLKSQSSVTNYFKNYSFKRSDFEKVRRVLQEKKLWLGFEEISF